MKIKCINPKSYRLTKDKEYEASFKDNYYTLRNDLDIEVTYHKLLFEEVIEEPAEIEYSLEEIISKISPDSDSYDFSIDVPLTNKKTISVHCNLNLEYFDVSCGIKGIYNIGDTFANIIDSVPDLPNLRGIVFRKMLTHLLFSVEETNAKFLLLSTYVLDNNFDELDSCLEFLSDSSGSGLNPNSGNEIKYWMVNVDNLR